MTAQGVYPQCVASFTTCFRVHSALKSGKLAIRAAELNDGSPSLHSLHTLRISNYSLRMLVAALAAADTTSASRLLSERTET